MMNKIIIYSDSNNIIEPQSENVLEINDISDYVYGYHSIQDAIYNKNQLEMIVRDKYCLNAFIKMQKMYGEEKIKIKKNYYREKIEDIIDMKIPDYIKKDDLIEIDFLEKSKEMNTEKGGGFEEFVLTNILNDFFAYKSFPIKNILSFFDQLDLDVIKNNKKNKLFKKVFKSKINSWKKKTDDELILKLIDLFLSDFKNLYKNISIYNLIYTYPENLVNKLIDKEYMFIKNLNFKKDGKKRDNILNLKKIEKFIEYYLNTKKVKDIKSGEIESIIHNLSGNFKFEFNYIINIISEDPTLIDNALLTELKTKYKNIIDYNDRNKLNNLIPPDRPESPAQLDSLNEWFNWLTNQYFDYRFWLENNNKEDDGINKYSFLYSSWLFENYIKLLSTEENVMPKIITSKLGDALEDDKTIIIIMLDNFNYKYADQLIEIFNKKSYTNFKKEPILSMIPSETYINKGTLLSMNTFEVDEKPDYNKLSQKIGKMYGKTTEYLSNIGKLEESKINRNQLYIVNYLMLDKTLHENQKQAASSLSNRIKSELEAIVQIIDDSINVTNDFETEVYIIPDHGSVKIPSSRMNLIPGFDEINIIDDGYRSVKISDANLKQIKKSDQDFYYIMDKNSFGVPHNYLIAKYYYRFKDTNDSFYVHGGLSPEETIVPLLGFKKENDNLEIELPNLNIKTKNIRKSVKNEIEFTLRNRNPFSLNDIKIELVNSELKCPNKIKYLEAVSAFEEEKILFSKVEISNNKSTIALLIDVSFNYLNNRYDERYKFDLSIKAIQENSFDLNDLL